jgi:DNA-binding NarL/FixJ family response regulator
MDNVTQTAELDARTGSFFRNLVERSARCKPRRFKHWSLEQLAELIRCDTVVWYLAGRDGHIGSSSWFVRNGGSSSSSAFLDVLPVRGFIAAGADYNCTLVGDPSARDKAVLGEQCGPDADGGLSLWITCSFTPAGALSVFHYAWTKAAAGLERARGPYLRALTPALVVSLRLCLERLLHSQSLCRDTRRKSDAAAVMEPSGLIVHSTSGFTETVRSVYGDWGGDTLPATLVTRLTSSATTRGLALGDYALQAKQVDGCYCLCVRSPDRIDRLSPTEREIARAWARGLSAKAIADARHTKISTVKTQIRSIYSKLGVANKAEFFRLYGREPELAEADRLDP